MPLLVPVPVHSVAMGGDGILLPETDCKRKRKLWGMVARSQVVRKVWDNSKGVVEKVCNETGSLPEFTQLSYVVDALKFEVSRCKFEFYDP